MKAESLKSSSDNKKEPEFFEDPAVFNWKDSPSIGDAGLSETEISMIRNDLTPEIAEKLLQKYDSAIAQHKEFVSYMIKDFGLQLGQDWLLKSGASSARSMILRIVSRIKKEGYTKETEREIESIDDRTLLMLNIDKLLSKFSSKYTPGKQVETSSEALHTDIFPASDLTEKQWEEILRICKDNYTDDKILLTYVTEALKRLREDAPRLSKTRFHLVNSFDLPIAFLRVEERSPDTVFVGTLNSNRLYNGYNVGIKLYENAINELVKEKVVLAEADPTSAIILKYSKSGAYFYDTKEILDNNGNSRTLISLIWRNRPERTRELTAEEYSDEYLNEIKSEGEIFSESCEKRELPTRLVELIKEGKVIIYVYKNSGKFEILYQTLTPELKQKLLQKRV